MRLAALILSLIGPVFTSPKPSANPGGLSSSNYVGPSPQVPVPGGYVAPPPNQPFLPRPPNINIPNLPNLPPRPIFPVPPPPNVPALPPGGKQTSNVRWTCKPCSAMCCKAVNIVQQLIPRKCCPCLPCRPPVIPIYPPRPPSYIFPPPRPYQPGPHQPPPISQPPAPIYVPQPTPVPSRPTPTSYVSATTPNPPSYVPRVSPTYIPIPVTPGYGPISSTYQTIPSRPTNIYRPVPIIPTGSYSVNPIPYKPYNPLPGPIIYNPIPNPSPGPTPIILGSYPSCCFVHPQALTVTISSNCNNPRYCTCGQLGAPGCSNQTIVVPANGLIKSMTCDEAVQQGYIRQDQLPSPSGSNIGCGAGPIGGSTSPLPLYNPYSSVQSGSNTLPASAPSLPSPTGTLETPSPCSSTQQIQPSCPYSDNYVLQSTTMLPSSSPSTWMTGVSLALLTIFHAFFCFVI